jgi:hypothetical protein
MNNKSKLVVEIGYRKYIVPTDKAVTLMEILYDAEIFEEKYRSKENGGTTYHCYGQDGNNRSSVSMYLIPESLYRMAKLAGKPEEK